MQLVCAQEFLGPYTLQLTFKGLQTSFRYRAKDVLPDINRTHAAEITLRQRRNGPVCC